MSYLVLARKYRPQLFADLIGQEHVSRTLANSISSGRIHHAFLFTGARGVGKTSAARILAKALNCERGAQTEPCNQCTSCQEITAGKSVDVFEIDGASNNGVDDIRELRDTLRYMPAHSRYKIFIIDEVHMLSINAFNALLKTLEEPPPHVKFIFATTEPHKIPVTILSRCQRFDFRKIPASKVVTQLQTIVAAEKIEISERSLALIAQRGGGSMRDCLSTLDQVVAFCSANVEDADVQSLLGVVDQRLLFDVLEACMQHNCSAVLEIVRRVDDLGHSFRQFSQELVEMVRRVILCGVVSDPQEELGLFADEYKALTSLVEMASMEDWQRLLSLLLKTETQLSSSVYPKLLVEMVLIRAASMPPSRDIASLINKIEALEAGSVVTLAPERRPVPPRKAVPAATIKPPSIVEAAPAPSVIPQNLEVSAESTELAADSENTAVVETEESYQPEVVAVDDSTVAAGATSLPSDGAIEVVSSTTPEVGTGGKSWLEFVQYVKKERPRIGSLLEHGSLLKFDLPRVMVGFERASFMLQQLSDAETKERLNSLAQQFFEQQVQVVVESLSAAAAAPLSLVAAEEKRESDRGRRLREDALAHPMVRKAVEIFSGEIEKITPIDKGFV
ncbi:MAG: DNA polymerase III subunit gamma/tau [Desulfuromonas sp.]|nr:DNA polymerase III subunit gamma/tau [Desulfuromonas sp.]